MRLLDKIDLEDRVAIDVGAHSGNWTLNLARRVGPTGVVLAYEALPHYGRALSISIRLQRARNVRVRNFAVGDCEKTISLRWRSNTNEMLTGRTHVEPGVQPSASVIEVPMVSLDRDLETCGVDPSDVGFVKIDVEGAELEVLRGACNLLSVGRPIVYLEAEPPWLERLGHTVEDVFDAMAAHGYRPHLSSEAGPTTTDVASYLAQYVDRREYNNVLFLPAKTSGSDGLR
ncbi:MAG: FkbM family methyltransferase [Mycolicibacterium sp.]|uniref:FkbM family methyltransferase n=1 Tax=Mycolicibacterium sp. TaxID=2320850 RepID=UPI003D1042BF